MVIVISHGIAFALAVATTSSYFLHHHRFTELEEMLVSLYGDIMKFDDIRPAVFERTGFIDVPA